MKLKKDIVSMFHGFVYGNAGDDVKVVATHGAVLIVVAESGSRFSVLATDVTEGSVPYIKPKPEPVEDQPMKKQPAKKKAAVSNNKQTLF